MEDNLLYQYEMPLFKKHSYIGSRVASIGGIFPNTGEITILCKNKNKKFNMGYFSDWNEEKKCHNEYEYEYEYCPLCGEKLEK